MIVDERLAALAGIVLFAWTVQAITGFGSTVLALTLGSWLFPIPELLPVTIVLNTPLSAWTTIRHRAHIDRGVLFGTVLPWMALGTAVGALLAPHLTGDWLKRGFGVMVVGFAVRDLVALARNEPPGAPLGTWLARAWVVAAGVLHGIYGSGGPALVQVTSRLGLAKGPFRATMSAVWIAFNGVLLALFLARGTLDATAAQRALVLLPVVPLGVWLGERIHPHVPDRTFRGLVQTVLVVGGIALLTG